MTSIWGNDNGGGGSGSNGHKVIVTYSYSQSIAGNYTDVAWQYGVDYGDPNYWNNISNRSIAWSVNVGSSVSGVSGYGTGTSSSPYINTSDPGYGGQIHYFWSGTVRLYHNSNGQGTIHLNASMTFNTGAYTSSINTNIALPNIIRPPSAPTLQSASRVNDGQINVSWTNNSGTYTAYTGVRVLRSVDGGGYAQIVQLGVVTSYSDTSVSANHKYQYKLEAYNAAGTAQSGATTALYTTPGAPSGATATKLAGGNIQVSWTNNVNYSEYQVDIYESQNGGAYAYVNSVASGNTSWTHVTPNPAVTHKYKVLAATTSGTALYSAYSNETATIVLLSTAAAPTGLAVTAQVNNPGSAKDGDEAITFTWTHNPTDATPQSSYQLQYSTNGGGVWTTVGPTASTVSSYTLPAATLANNNTVTWRVATAGENGTIGAYSSNATFDLRARPTATFSAPGASYTQSLLTATWTFFQAQSGTQTAWQAWLFRDNGGGSYTQLETKNGTTETSVAFTTALLDGGNYAVRVRVTSSQGLQSTDTGGEDGWQLFSVTFLPPAQVYIDCIYDADWGRTVVIITGDGAVGGVTEAIDYVDVFRKIDGGEWIRWAAGIVLSGAPLTSIIVDAIPTVKGENIYKAVAYSALPSSVESSQFTITTTGAGNWGFLNVSPEAGFADVARMRARLSNRATSGRSKATYHFAGREDPVELSGEETTRRLAIVATLYPVSRGGLSTEPEDLENMGETKSVAVWRDSRGRRIFASLSDVNVDYPTISNIFPAAFNLTRVDYDENVG